MGFNGIESHKWTSGAGRRASHTLSSTDGLNATKLMSRSVPVESYGTDSSAVPCCAVPASVLLPDRASNKKLDENQSHSCCTKTFSRPQRLVARLDDEMRRDVRQGRQGTRSTEGVTIRQAELRLSLIACNRISAMLMMMNLNGVDGWKCWEVGVGVEVGD